MLKNNINLKKYINHFITYKNYTKRNIKTF